MVSTTTCDHVVVPATWSGLEMCTSDDEEASTPEAKCPILLTALDLPVDDHGVHELGSCRLVTMQHADCGLIW